LAALGGLSVTEIKESKLKKQLKTKDSINGAPLELKDVLNVVFKMTDYLNFQWNFYVIINIALIGWIFSSPIDAWGWQKKLICSIAYLLSVLMSIMVLSRTYRLLFDVLEELSYCAKDIQFRSDKFRTAFKEVRPVNKKFSITLHIIGNVIVLLCIWIKGEYF
jgi:hypothetical protein